MGTRKLKAIVVPGEPGCFRAVILSQEPQQVLFLVGLCVL